MGRPLTFDQKTIQLIRKLADQKIPGTEIAKRVGRHYKGVNALMVRLGIPRLPRNRFPKGRKNPWVGCNIVLRNIPNDAKIGVVIDGAAVTPAKVRQQFERLRPLKELSVKERGWTLDVLRVVQSLGRKEFKTSDMYEHVRHFEQLHPDNRHIRDKIRQQLQVLRDRGFLKQHERGVWAVR